MARCCSNPLKPFSIRHWKKKHGIRGKGSIGLFQVEQHRYTKVSNTSNFIFSTLFSVDFFSILKKKSHYNNCLIVKWQFCSYHFLAISIIIIGKYIYIVPTSPSSVITYFNRSCLHFICKQKYTFYVHAKTIFKLWH